MNLSRAGYEIDRLEQLALGNSPVHRLHPRVKIIGAFAYILAVVSIPAGKVSALMPFFLYPAVLMPLSDTPFKPLFLRLLTALPFSLMGGISSLVMIREPAFSLGGITITSGVLSFCSIMLKAALTVLAVLILIATTSFVEIACHLCGLGLPKILSLQLVMTYRYIGVLLGEAASMVTAYKLRAPDSSGIGMGDMGSFLGQLVLRSFDRAERVYQAMKCRGFHGVYQGAANRKAGPFDYGFAAAVIAAAAVPTVLARI
ncbi:MAG: cobalt ECF transporter T component CbiQ [Spirochaetaceae bacterium]|nr:cobalt ECF transporter T component CbiQ [Spirochaetaceae bacterium]